MSRRTYSPYRPVVVYDVGEPVETAGSGSATGYGERKVGAAVVEVREIGAL